MKKIILILIPLILIGILVVQKNDNAEVVNNDSVCGMTVLSPFDGQVFGEISQVLVLIDNTNREVLGCSWTVFEAQAGTFAFFDGEGKQVAFGLLQAQEGVDWMTAEPVEYSGTIDLTEGISITPGLGKLVITEDDPSGEKVVSQKEITIQF